MESDAEIDRRHRIGSCKTKTGQTRDQPCTVVCRLNRFKDKQRILNNAKKLKNTGIVIYDDFSKENMELKKSLWEQVLEYRKQSKFAWLNYRSIIHSKESQWCKINIDLFYFSSVTLSFKNGRYNY